MNISFFFFLLVVNNVVRGKMGRDIKIISIKLKGIIRGVKIRDGCCKVFS